MTMKFPRMMKLSLVSLMLLVPLVRALIKRCPHESLIQPCICAEHYAWGSEVTCKDFDSTDTLQKVFENTNTYSFDMLNLHNCAIPYLKNTWISSKGIYRLHIVNVTAVELFQNEGDTAAPSLKHIALRKSKVLRKVRWQQFKPFTQLKTLTMSETEVKKLGKDFRDYVSTHLKLLAVEGARFTGLEDGDLDGKPELSSISFKNNKIKVLRNSFFKDLRAVLSNMDFSNNPIESITNDLFEGMTALRYVFLRGAQIKTLSKLPNFRGYLYLGENPLVCDCNMSWITRNNDFFIDGTCESPSFLKSRPLRELTLEDFGACNSLPFEH